MGWENNPLVEGVVEGIIHLDGYTHEHYIISIQTAMDDLLEVRSGSNVSDTAKGPVGWLRK